MDGCRSGTRERINDKCCPERKEHRRLGALKGSSSRAKKIPSRPITEIGDDRKWIGICRK